MNWPKWTTNGWATLKRAVTGENQQVEMTRLVDGLDALHRVAENMGRNPILEAPDDQACACCGGRRCWAWRSSKHTVGCGGHTEEDKCWRINDENTHTPGCGGESEPIPVETSFRQLIEHALVRPGRHTIRYVAQHAVPWNWSPIPLRTRVRRWPTQYALRLGRAPQIGLTRNLVLP